MSPLNIRPLSKELQDQAATELNEDPGRIEADLEAFKAWLAKTPYLKTRTDDQFLINFLRGCKFSLERAKEKIDAYYTVRTAIPEIFANRAVTEDIINLIKLGVMVPLPQSDGPNGPKIILIRGAKYDPETIEIERLFKATTMLQDILLFEDDRMIVSGCINLIDAKGGSLAHMRQYTPTFLKKYVMIWNSNPLRLKGGHYFNTPSIFNTFFNIFKSFLSEKIKSRVSFRCNY